MSVVGNYRVNRECSFLQFRTCVNYHIFTWISLFSHPLLACSLSKLHLYPKPKRFVFSVYLFEFSSLDYLTVVTPSDILLLSKIFFFCPLPPTKRSWVALFYGDCWVLEPFLFFPPLTRNLEW